MQNKVKKLNQKYGIYDYLYFITKLNRPLKF